jgi:hypothetical protein
MGCGTLGEKESNHSVLAKESSAEVDDAVQKVLSANLTSPFTEIALRISCCNLPNTDLTSKSDPYAAVFMKKPSGLWDLIKVTEVVSNNLNPTFITLINTKFYFEEKQVFKIHIYDQDDEDLYNFSKQDLLGSAEGLISDIFTTKEKSYDLKGKHNKGTVKISCEVVKASRQLVTMKMTLPMPHCFLLISKKTTSDWAPIYKSEVTGEVVNEFKPIQVSASLLCNNDNDLPILFQIFQYNKNGSHKLHGELCMSLNQLIEKRELKTGGN